MKDEIKEILRNCEKAINEASGYNDTTNKILDYITNLQKENERLNENKRHTLNAINRTIEIIKQQPTEDDSWILDRLDGFKYVLQGEGKEWKRE